MTGRDVPTNIIASLLNLSDQRIRQMCANGDLPGAYKTGSRDHSHWRIPRQVVAEIKQNQQNKNDNRS